MIRPCSGMPLDRPDRVDRRRVLQLHDGEFDRRRRRLVARSPGTVHSGPDRNAGRHSSSPAVTAAARTTTRPTHGEADLHRLAHADDGTVRLRVRYSQCSDRSRRPPDRPRTLLHADPAELTAALVDIPSVSGTRGRSRTPIESGPAGRAALQVERVGNAVLARTDLGRPTRVLLAGHIDTVPIADNVPSRRDGDTLHGCGTTDMKSGDAMLLHLAATLPEPCRDLTFVFYDCEEIEYERNGLTRIQAEYPEWLARGPGDPGRADQRPGRGRLPGHRRGGHHGARQALALGAIMAGGQRDSQVGRGARPARRRSTRGSSTSTVASITRA